MFATKDLQRTYKRHRITVTLVLLFLVAIRQTWAFHCPILECSCFYNGRETVKIACPPEHHGVQYTVTHHIVQGELNVECLEPITYRPAMFRLFNFSNIIHIQFIRCPLPINITFPEILQGLHPRIINFNGNDQDAVLSPSLFANLSGLETLDLDGNGFVDIESEQIGPQTLESLSLDENQLTKVPQSLLRAMPGLTGLTIAGNTLRFLSDDDFTHVPFLQILKLDHNQVESVGAGVFKPLKVLKLLQLNDNRLHVLPPQLLYNQTHLQFLDLSENQLERISDQFFKDNIHLKILRVNKNNHLKDIPEDLLKSLASLDELHMSENNISTLPELLFQNTLALTKLHMRANSLATLPQGIFANASRLSLINLAENDLTSLSAGVFDALTELRELNLSHNMLKALESGTFATQIELLSLDLSHNLLESISPQTFEFVQHLRFLDLSYNFLTFIEHIPPFTVPLSLESFNLSNNMIGSLSLGWTQSGRLREFNVSYNQIKYVLVKVGYTTQSSDTSVDLRHNLVNTVEISDGSMEGQRAIVATDRADNSTDVATTVPFAETTVLLADNPIACDCNLLSFVTHLLGTERNQSSLRFEDAQMLVCTTPHGLVDKPVMTVLPEELFCPVYEHCEGCSCIQKAVDRSVTMDCRQKSMSSFPFKAPQNTTVLHLEGNNITTLKHLSNSMWSNLTELYVNDNSLTNMDFPVSMPKNLRIIHLDNNQMEYLPEWFIANVNSSFNETMLSLGKNPWVCDCRNVAFQRWLAYNPHRVTDHADIICKARKVERRVQTYVYGHLNRMYLIECRSPGSSNKTAVIMAAVMILGITSILLLGTKLMWRNFYKVKIFLLELVVKRPTNKCITSESRA